MKESYALVTVEQGLFVFTGTQVIRLLSDGGLPSIATTYTPMTGMPAPTSASTYIPAGYVRPIQSAVVYDGTDIWICDRTIVGVHLLDNVVTLVFTVLNPTSATLDFTVITIRDTYPCSKPSGGLVKLAVVSILFSGNVVLGGQTQLFTVINTITRSVGINTVPIPPVSGNMTSVSVVSTQYGTLQYVIDTPSLITADAVTLKFVDGLLFANSPLDCISFVIPPTSASGVQRRGVVDEDIAGDYECTVEILEISQKYTTWYNDQKGCTEYLDQVLREYRHSTSMLNHVIEAVLTISYSDQIIATNKVVSYS